MSVSSNISLSDIVVGVARIARVYASPAANDDSEFIWEIVALEFPEDLVEDGPSRTVLLGELHAHTENFIVAVTSEFIVSPRTEEYLKLGEKEARCAAELLQHIMFDLTASTARELAAKTGYKVKIPRLTPEFKFKWVDPDDT